MGKDPAVLFYTSDFLSGTLTMSNEHTGMYIKLLCLQHQKGRLTEEDMLYICKTHVKHVFLKFTKDENGLYYNERMEEESLRRKRYSKSRRDNVLSRYKPKKGKSTYVEHMENETITENETVNTTRGRFIKPSLNDVKTYCKERKNNVNAQKFIDFYEAKGWLIGKNKMKDWKACVRTWEGRVEEKGAYKPASGARVKNYEETAEYLRSLQ